MGFASAWLNKNALFPEFIKEAPDNQTGIIIVVPAFNEPYITSLLECLKSCDEPDCQVEVLVVINAPSDASSESIRNNSVCKQNIEKWIGANNDRFLRIYYFNTGIAPVDDWGVGLARKSGMDEALRRFDKLGEPDGIIVSLDADCIVEKNYLTAFCNEFYKKKERKACSVYFEHPLTGNQFPGRLYDYIAQYELHLRYFVQGLRYSGFPYAFHTVGSALAVKALQYVKAGGMNRRQAGEDFYFIQKLAPLGGYFYLNSTTVFPSPRESYRVPFGTGVMMKKLMDDSGNRLLTYNTKAFSDLKNIFEIARKMYLADQAEVLDSYEVLPAGISFLTGKQEWNSKINEIQRNTSSFEAFMKRFFIWFNMFRIVKYLNNIHAATYSKVPVEESAGNMLAISGMKNIPKDIYELLIYYRRMEKGLTTTG